VSSQHVGVGASVNKYVACGVKVVSKRIFICEVRTSLSLSLLHPLSRNKYTAQALLSMMAARSRSIQPASSSDDDSQSASEDDRRMTARMEAYDSDGSIDSDVEEHKSKPLNNFDDLPTDDSESDSDDSQSDADSEQNSEDSSDDEDEEADEADVPLSERVASRALQGRRYQTDNQDEDNGKQQRAQRKSRAIELASQRLREAKKSAKTSKKDDSEEQSSSAEEQTKRKKSKHAPTEMSSKRRDFYSRKTDLNSSGIGVSIGANKYKPRDPRIISLSGHLDEDLFEKRYSFLNEVRVLWCSLRKLHLRAGVHDVYQCIFVSDAAAREGNTEIEAESDCMENNWEKGFEAKEKVGNDSRGINGGG
jgi:hypothetical protein